jgi:hypothetical protein
MHSGLKFYLYFCIGKKIRSRTLREENKLRVFEDRVLRRIFGHKREEVKGGWRKLHNKELCNFYSLPDIIMVIKSRILRWAGHVALMGVMRNVCKILFIKPEGKRPLEILRHKWENNIKMDVKEIGCEGVDWIHLAQDRDQYEHDNDQLSWY